MTGILFHTATMSEHPFNSLTNIEDEGVTKSWKSSVVESMTPLSDSFSPGPYDVICSHRGKKAKCHAGNIYFQQMVERQSERYSKAEGKLGKTLIVSEIIDTIRGKSPGGGFVKQENGKWYEVGDWSAREKVSQSLRDLLHGHYRSSASSKKRRREETNAKLSDDLNVLIESNEFVSNKIKKLSKSIETEGSKVSDLSLMVMMTQANSDILDELKQENPAQNETDLSDEDAKLAAV